MYLEEQGKSQDTKHTYMKYNTDVSKAESQTKDICASAGKWQKREKLAGVSLVLQLILCLGVSANSICMNLDG